MKRALSGLTWLRMSELGSLSPVMGSPDKKWEFQSWVRPPKPHIFIYFILINGVHDRENWL